MSHKDNDIAEGPFVDALRADDDNVVRRELITYKHKNGIVVKETATRTYTAKGDYNDSVASIPITNVLF